MMSAGMVKMAPEATDVPAEAMVWTMLFSRMVRRRNALRTARETTAAGMLAATVRPAFRPRYVLAAPRRTARARPSRRPLKVTSAIEWCAGTCGMSSPCGGGGGGGTAAAWASFIGGGRRGTGPLDGGRGVREAGVGAVAFGTARDGGQGIKRRAPRSA